MDRDAWVVVSGGGGAIGVAVGAAFAARGNPVLAVDRAFSGDTPSGVTRLVADLTSAEEVKGALASVAKAGGRIGLLVNAVGLIWNEPVLAFKGARLTTHSVDSLRRVIDANLIAPFVVAQEAAALMVRGGGGVIVNFSSIAADGNAGQAAYSAAKAGVEGMTKTMAAELGQLGVRVVALALGFIEVPTTLEAVGDDKLADHARRTPAGRLGALDDVIEAIDFAAKNGFLTGTVIKLDGGLRL